MYDDRSHSEGTVGDWLIGAAKRNPEAFLVLAAGCALLLRGRGNGASNRSSSVRYGASGREFESYEEDLEAADEFGTYRDEESYRRSKSGMRERMSGMAETAGEYASEVTDRVYDTAASAASAASAYASRGRRVVSRSGARPSP